MESADRALYRAKKEGRNRWCFADAESARRDAQRSHALCAEKLRNKLPRHVE